VPSLTLLLAIALGVALAGWGVTITVLVGTRTRVRVRVLHTGTVVRREDDIFGRNVAMAARVASQAAGGEVLVSDDVHDLMADDYVFVDCRVARLKGFDGDHQLWELGWPLS